MHARRSCQWIRSGVLTAVVALAALPAGPTAEARENGLTTSGCAGCHTGGRAPTVSLSLDPPAPEPGARATVRLRVSASNGGGVGFYLHAYNKGTFSIVPGQGARAATETDVVHASPKPGVDGTAVFEIGWTAPMMRGTVDLEVHAVASNGNGAISGDGTEKARLAVTVGCPGIEAFLDADQDGFGSDAQPKTRICEMQPGYSDKGGDCNDYLSRAYPGAPELCNEVDDDCDGMINEGLESVTFYKDADGDGYGDFVGADSRVGCMGPGYSRSRDDCDDSNRMVNPSAKETCNNKDDNCNGRVDEGAKVTCGVGWCRQTAASCESRLCEPGPPRAELCNSFDDDCDGVVDNAASCSDGRVCYQGRCLAAGDAKAQAEAEMMTSGPGAAVDAGAPTGSAGSGPPMSGAGGRAGPAAEDGAKAGLSCALGAQRAHRSMGGAGGGVGLLLGLMALAAGRCRRRRTR